MNGALRLTTDHLQRLLKTSTERYPRILATSGAPPFAFPNLPLPSHFYLSLATPKKCLYNNLSLYKSILSVITCGDLNTRLSRSLGASCNAQSLVVGTLVCAVRVVGAAMGRAMGEEGKSGQVSSQQGVSLGRGRDGSYWTDGHRMALPLAGVTLKLSLVKRVAPPSYRTQHQRAGEEWRQGRTQIREGREGRG